MSWGLWEISDSHFRWSTGQDKVPAENNIYSDGAAYYSYLPNWFYSEHGDFSFMDSVMHKYPNSRFDDNLERKINDRGRENKYYTGTAVLITPFFLLAHTIESAQGNDVDGYDTVFLLMASIAAIFYWFMGAVAIYLLLKRMKIPSPYILLSIAVITFGTNLSHYVIYAPTYAHVYSFACSGWVLYIAARWVESNRNLHFILLGLLIGLSFIIRPTNVVILLFIPFFFNSSSDLFKRLKTLFTKRYLYLLLFLFAIGLSIMFHFWNLGALNTYKKEGFDNLFDPFICEVLFGVRRGIFFYAPALFISLAGLIILYRKKRRYFWGFLLVFSVFTYLISSWWCWWYGGSFSMRPFVDILPIFSIPLAFLLYRTYFLLRLAVILVLLASVGLTQVYTYQFNHHIIHYDGMNWTDFKTVFLQTDERFEWYPYFSFDKLSKSYNRVLKVRSFDYHTNYAPNKYSLIEPISDTNGMFAARITGEIKIESSIGKPHIKLMYYRNDTIIRENYVFIGAQIPKVEEYESVSIDVFPELNLDELDSVGIILFDGSTRLKAKELKLHLYSK